MYCTIVVNEIIAQGQQHKTAHHRTSSLLLSLFCDSATDSSMSRPKRRIFEAIFHDSGAFNLFIDLLKNAAAIR